MWPSRNRVDQTPIKGSEGDTGTGRVRVGIFPNELLLHSTHCERRMELLIGNNATLNGQFYRTHFEFELAFQDSKRE